MMRDSVLRMAASALDEIHKPIILNVASDAETAIRNLGLDSNYPYFAFQVSFQMFSTWVMRWDL